MANGIHRQLALLSVAITAGPMVSPSPTERKLAGSTTDHYLFTRHDASGSECVLPWVAGGRIPVTTVEDADTVVDQIVRYERTPPCDPEHYRRMTFAAYFQDDHPQDDKADRAYMLTMERIREHLVGLGFDVARVYVSNNPAPKRFKDASSVPPEVAASIVDGGTATDLLISELSEGQVVIGHRDHGMDTGWAHPALLDTHLKGVHSSAPSLLYSINCRTGRFDAVPHDSFAEAALKMDGGPPSLIAATENSGSWRNDSMMKALFDALWPGVIPTFPGTTASYPVRANRLGDLLAYAKSYLLVAHGVTGGVKHHLEIYHVIGDPTLEVWDEVPRAVRLRAWRHGRQLRVWMSECPAGAVVTVWHDGELVKRIEPRFTSLTLPLPRRSAHRLPGPRGEQVSVCFGAPGHRFTEVRCTLR